MGTMGLALPWKARISSLPRERGTRVEPSEHFAGGPSLPVTDALSEDAALAAGCRAGDLRAYERLYSRHGARMKNLARNVLGNPSDAEDAVQETFLKVQRSIASFRGQSSFVTWTFRILINTCYDARRSRLRKKEVANNDSEETPRLEPRAPGAHRSRIIPQTRTARLHRTAEPQQASEVRASARRPKRKIPFPARPPEPATTSPSSAGGRPSAR